MSMNVRQVWQDVNTNAETRMVAFSVFARLVTSLILIIGPVLIIMSAKMASTLAVKSVVTLQVATIALADQGTILMATLERAKGIHVRPYPNQSMDT